MKAPAILTAAIDTMAQRGQQRDQPQGERSIPAVVAAFNALTGHAITEQQGCLFMALLKIKRAQSGKPDIDNYVDGASYFALAGEAALATGKDSLPVHAAPSVVNEQLTTAETAHAELQDLLRQRYEQLGTASVYGLPDGTLRYRTFCRGCGGTGNCAIDPAHDIRCPACHGEGVRYWIACPDCARTGFTPGSGGDSATFCPTCRGKGELPATRPERGPYTLDPDGTLHGLAGTHNIQDVPEGCCPICAGTGYANQDTRELCHTCGGTGAD